MIYLFVNKQRIREFRSYEEILEYFNRIETSKLLERNSLQDEQKWNFIYYTYRKPSNDSRSGESGEIENYEKKQDVIEVYTGDSQNSYQIPVSSELDILELMRDWCFNYCYAHGFRLFEEIDEKGNSKTEDHPLIAVAAYDFFSGKNFLKS